MTKPKVILFDIECFHMNWDASVGVIFCMCWKELGTGKVHTESLWANPGKGILDDKQVLKKMHDVLKDADMWITYNGIRFDVPFIQTRLLANELPVLPPVAHKDLYYTPRFKLKLHSNSLFSVQTFLQLKNKKTPVDLRQWLKALAGDKKAQKEIIVHCENDVLVLEECYLKLRPLMLSHPRLYGYGPCNACGAEKLQSRGTYYTAGKHHKRRFYCTACGKWETRNEPASKQKSV